MNRRDDHRRCGGPPNADNHETVPAVQERDAAADSRPGIRSEVRRSVPMGVQLLQLLGVGLMQAGVILADPPWRYRNFTDSVHGAAASQYDTMPAEEIAALPVASWYATDSVLAFWATWPKLPDAFQIIKAWGFEYVSGVPWIKTLAGNGEIRRGIGFWTQSASEAILFARKGDPERTVAEPVLGLLVGEDRQFYAERRRHSRKPREIHAWLEASFLGPYLELFATSPRPNWITWGLETGFLLLKDGVRPMGDRPTVLTEFELDRPVVAKNVDDGEA